MILTATEKQLIVSTYRLVVPIAETVADLFYRRLFENAPQYRVLFPEDMTRQKHKLIAMLTFITTSLDWTDEQWSDAVDPQEDLFLVVLAMGRRHHCLYKIPDEAYGPVEMALMWSLDQSLGQGFTPDLRVAWTKLYRALAATMKMGARATRINMDLGRIQ